MEDLIKQARELQQAVVQAIDKLGLPGLEAELEKLKSDSQAQDFWSDNLKAQEVMKRIGKLEGRIAPWRKLEEELSSTLEMAEMEDAASIEPELRQKIINLDRELQALKRQLKFSGPFDGHDAIVSIHAGAGGTDAQDWAQMLLRMYLRYIEKASMSAVTIEESAGDEAGIKSVTFEVSGNFAYGLLKGEHGVHRLVRLSPFNADNLRQTSFAKVEVIPKIDTPEAVGIDEKDLRIDVYRSGGKGGQSVNTTDSAVRITHQPTGIVVAIQNERSQLQNKETALAILRGKLAQLQAEQHLEDIAELKGPNEQAAWGNQIRSYVLHPYKQVKDLRTRYESTDPDAVLDGELAPFIEAFLEHGLGS